MFTNPDELIAWQHVAEARLELADYLATLTEDQWNVDSLCGGWQVRDVVAHLILIFQYSARKDWRDFIRSGLNVNHFIKRTAISYGRKSSTQLLSQFRATCDQQRKPASLSVINVLADVLIHEQDIRLPLNQPRAMPMESLRLIFTHWQPTKFNLGEKITGIASRTRNLEFVIEDLEMRVGAGAEVIGNAQDILMAVVGRKSSVHMLRGSGAGLLRNRLK